jgi:predicted metal-dependent HD superfamily phosphohydrolase
MESTVVVVRCPRCGSMDAGSVEAIHVEFDRMKCRVCGHEQVCDDYEIKDNWNETVPTDAVPREQRHVLPDVRFRELWTSLGAHGYARDVFLGLRAAYDEPSRAYHTARHIGACLRLLDEPEVKALATHLPEVEAAIWFHDAIYDTHASDNEERSARMMEESLSAAGVASDDVGRIAAHVRATKDHVPHSVDDQLVIDIDLSILGESADVFERFEEEIRREYAWVESAAYVVGRAAVLRRFSERPFIYGTPLFRARYESRARENITASLKKLAGLLSE